MTSISCTSPFLIAITPLGTAWGNRRVVGVCVFNSQSLPLLLARGDIQKLSAVEIQLSQWNAISNQEIPFAH